VLIKEAARLSGVKASALRMWELRYGWPRPVVLSNGYRAYSPELVAQIAEVRKRRERGDGPLADVIQSVAGTVKS
jgi:DNA-binding transcriptional MerR regulator